MEVMFMTLGILALIIIGMSVGVLMGGKPIAGSCGGMAALEMDTACMVCGGDPKKCEDEQERLASEAGADFDLATEVKTRN